MTFPIPSSGECTRTKYARKAWVVTIAVVSVLVVAASSLGTIRGSKIQEFLRVADTRWSKENTTSVGHSDDAAIDETRTMINHSVALPHHPDALHPRTIYLCGFDLWDFYHYVFTDYQDGGWLTLEHLRSSQASDIVFQVGLDGPCPISVPQLRDEFLGKVVFINTEARTHGDAEKQRLSERFIKLGPSEDPNEPRTLMRGYYFGAMVLFGSSSKEERRMVLDADYRRQHAPPTSTLRDAAVFLVSNCLPDRRAAAQQISQLVIPVHFGPKCGLLPGRTRSNTSTTRIPKSDLTPRNKYQHNFQIYAKYKFCLVMENTNTAGYMTEKIILAYLGGGCIPIYWGTAEIFDVFHPDSFVYWNATDPRAALEELQYLQANAPAYTTKRSHPILRYGHQTLRDYFSYTDDVGSGYLKRQLLHKLQSKDDDE